MRTADDQATASVDVTWHLGRGRTWKYLSELELRPAPETEEGWRIQWAPTVVHPELAAGQRLARRTRSPRLLLWSTGWGRRCSRPRPS